MTMPRHNESIQTQFLSRQSANGVVLKLPTWDFIGIIAVQELADEVKKLPIER